MDALTLLLLAPLVLVGEAALVAHLFRRPLSGHGPRFRSVAAALSRGPSGVVLLSGLWLMLTGAAFVYEFFGGLVLLYALIFIGGDVAGWAGLLFLAALFVATPGMCGWVVLRLGRGLSAPGDGAPVRTAGAAGGALRRA